MNSKLSKYSPLKLKFSLIIFRNADTQVLRIFFLKSKPSNRKVSVRQAVDCPFQLF